MARAGSLAGAGPRAPGPGPHALAGVDDEAFVEWQIIGAPVVPEARPPLVVICDDDPSVRLVYRVAFERAGVEVREVPDGEACLQVVLAHQPKLIVLDLYLPGMGGLATLRELGRLCPETPVIVVSGRAASETFLETRRLGARASFSKSRFQERIPDIVRRYCSGDPEPPTTD